jgi:hypothetical protein
MFHPDQDQWNQGMLRDVTIHGCLLHGHANTTTQFNLHRPHANFVVVVVVVVVVNDARILFAPCCVTKIGAGFAH